MNLETNVLLESVLEPNLMEESHELLAVGSHMEPKNDSILSIVNLEVAEAFDSMVAQPLLAGGLPEVGHLAGDPTTTSPMVLDVPATTLGVSSPSSPEMEMTLAQPLRAGYLPEANQRIIEPEANPITAAETTVGAPSGPNGVPFDEFPPLVKGRTLKLRDSFETGVPKQGKGAANPRLKEGAQTSRTTPATDGHATRCTAPPAGVTEGAHVVGAGAGDGSANNNPFGSSQESNTPRIMARPGSGSNSANPNQAGGAGDDAGHANKPRSMADLLRDRPDPNGPQVFVPDKMENIGYASLSNGIPAIYFSGAEIQKLAENVGHAIVGKFSHSIPSSHQIQKALDNIKFSCRFSWKYINAKHILVQFDDLADYARLLSGPKGTPVWFIDRHPMRVFKWTPEFDAYCESPIAAIWCNLIGLPIHLFDQSALFAIGKLLGNPIQVDRDTANKTRLSFARICVEIDITKPPPEEIILDICGRETVQQVRWGKIPSYCRECKHVGHTSEVCYAAGKVERPPKRNYNKATPKQTQHDDRGSKEKQDQPNQNTNNDGWKQQGRNKGSGGNSSTVTKGKEAKGPGWQGPDIMGELQAQPEGEFGTQGKQGGRDPGEGHGPIVSMDSAFIPYGRGPMSDARGSGFARMGSFPYARGGSRGAGRFSCDGGRGGSSSRNYMSSNKYYSLMANGDFDVDGCGEDESSEMDAQTSGGEKANIPLSIEGGSNYQLIEFQGGSSSSPGTAFPC